MGFDCKKWLNPQALDLWSEWTASCSLFDIDPESKSLDALASDPTSIRVLLDAEGGAGNIKYHIYKGVRHYLRKDFIEWAVSKKFPVREEMLIFAGKLKPKPEIKPDADQPTKTKSVNDETAAAVKPRKKLKPLEKERNEGLLLIYEMLKFYNVEYLDELPTVRAWGKIVSGEFQSDLIKSISDAKKSITLNGGEKLDKEAFSDKYRRRFK